MRVVLVDNEDGRFVADFGTRVFLHVTLKKWSVSKFKEYSIILESTLDGIWRGGVNEVFATPRVADVRAQKLIRMFGFEERGRACGLVIMSRRLYA